jgi:uncharacterized protein (UPF0297 family)
MLLREAKDSAKDRASIRKYERKVITWILIRRYIKIRQ